jgi:hypothetical protein
VIGGEEKKLFDPPFIKGVKGTQSRTKKFWGNKGEEIIDDSSLKSGAKNLLSSLNKEAVDAKILSSVE